MKTFLIVVCAVITVIMIAGYFIFISIFDSKFNLDVNGFGNNEMDSEKDLMRPTFRKLNEFLLPYQERFTELKLEEIEITSFDGLKLKGYLLNGNHEEVVICVHGYKSCKEFDFADKLEIYQKRGSTVLFLSNRAHDGSEGRYIGFGELDTYDVLAWISKVNRMFEKPRIYLHGVSMGGATIIHCADKEMENVRGIIDDCGYDSIIDIVRYLFRTSYHIPFFPFGYVAWFFAEMIANISFTDSIGEETVKNARCPILFIHGKEDHFVPCSMSESMYKAANCPKELHLIDNCGHAAAYCCNKEEYTDAVNRLMNGEIQ